MSTNQLGLYGHNQIAFNTAENHKPALEVIDLQVGSLLYTPGMFSQPLVQVGRF